MLSSPSKRIASPCRTWEACLSPRSGSAWDVTRAGLELRELPFGTRTFGWHGVWSRCSRYFAISEWLRGDESYYPDMQLIIVDVKEGKECVVERVAAGFIEPMYFLDDDIKFTKIAAGMEERAVEHRRLADLKKWRTVSGTPEA